MIKDEIDVNRKLYESEEAANYYAQEGFVDREAEILFCILENNTDRILDLGCGAGRSTKAIYDLGFRKILGVDYSSSMIALARHRYPDLRFEQGDACALNFSDNSFDIVLFLYQGIDCIESDEKRAAAYKEIFRIIKPGGTFVHSAHNIFWLNTKIRTTWIPLLRDVFSRKAFTGSYRTLPHGYGEETLSFRKRDFVVYELRCAGFNNIRTVKSRNCIMPIFQPYWHYIAKKP